MKNILSITIIALSLLTTTSCRKHSLRGEGATVSETRSLSSFEHVQADGDIEVTVIPSTSNKVIVSGYHNLVPVFETEVRGRTLHLRFADEKYNVRNNNISIILYTTSMTGFTINGSGEASIREGLEVGDMDLEVNGSGDIDIEGSYFNTMRLKINGSGTINARSAETDIAYADISGSGNIELTVHEILDVKISGSGTVDYWGLPETVNTEISGSGKVKKH
jgi:hypothetical protein